MRSSTAAVGVWNFRVSALLSQFFSPPTPPHQAPRIPPGRVLWGAPTVFFTAETASKRGSKFDVKFHSSWEGVWCDLGVDLGAQVGPSWGPFGVSVAVLCATPLPRRFRTRLGLVRGSPWEAEMGILCGRGAKNQCFRTCALELVLNAFRGRFGSRFGAQVEAEIGPKTASETTSKTRPQKDPHKSPT